MSKLKDLTGQRFGRLTVIERAENYVQPNGKAYPMWRCKCECGEIAVILGSNLRKGNTKSCGCLQQELRRRLRIKHGKSKTRLYKIWGKMKNRCYNSKSKDYKDYGGRGIRVCKEWRDSFEAFEAWAYSAGFNPESSGEDCSIERKNYNGNYEPSNCTWVTMKEQTRNTRRNRYITINGETKTLIGWCEKLGVSKSTFYTRLKAGFSEYEALGIVPRKKTE